MMGKMTDRKLTVGLSSFARSTRFHFVGLLRVRADMVLNFVMPIFYSSIAYYIYMAGDRTQDLRSLMLGAGLMGMWSTVLFGASTMIKDQRVQGTLELLLGAPKPLFLSVAPMATATSFFGAMAVLLTYAWGVVVFHAPWRVEDLPGTLLAVAVTSVSMSSSGLLLAALFVQVRRAESVASPLLAILWIISGIFVPAQTLPTALGVVAHLFPIAWGAEALRAASTGLPFVTSLLWCLLVSAVYAAIGTALINIVADAARKKGEVNLW
jgi:ABC-2 type transport system permease protein